MAISVALPHVCYSHFLQKAFDKLKWYCLKVYNLWSTIYVGLYQDRTLNVDLLELSLCNFFKRLCRSCSSCSWSLLHCLGTMSTIAVAYYRYYLSSCFNFHHYCLVNINFLWCRGTEQPQSIHPSH